MDQALIPLSSLRSTLRDGRSTPWTGRRGRRPRRDVALELGYALRNRVYRIGPVYKSTNPRGDDGHHFDDRNTYVLRVQHREFPWVAVEQWLERVYRTDQDAWALQDYLWAKEPTRVQFLIARPHLIQLWNYLNGNSG